MPSSPRPRRSSLAALALGLLVLAAGPVAAASASTASVTRGRCTSSATDVDRRAAAFTVRVREPRRSTRSYGFAARLQERAPGDRWRTLRGAEAPQGLDGSFRAARTGAPRMVRRVTVRALRPSRRYRLRVRVGWTDARGARHTKRLTSRSCLARGPDVAIGTDPVVWSPGTGGGEVVYRVGLAIHGSASLPAGGEVTVVVRQGDATLGSVIFSPRARPSAVAVPGARCRTGAPITVTLDPDHELRGAVAGDAVRTTPCQAAGDGA